KSWQFYYIWFLNYTSIFGLFVLGIIDWNTYIFQNLFWFIFGVILFIIGLFLLSWGVHTLSLYVSHGAKAEFITKGPYKFSRNPQYLGISTAILGYVFLTNSILAFITGMIGVNLFLITPLVEEPWLRKEYGSKYDEYIKKVRRFL
ncbi:MAG: methyltransferase family protein, partial [Promethearchaeota archaeon]